MKTYVISNKHVIKGRGTILTVAIPREDALPCKGELVLIDDIEYTIIGVECSRNMLGRCEYVGLNIRGVWKEPDMLL